jgi:hypothetical protein
MIIFRMFKLLIPIKNYEDVHKKYIENENVQLLDMLDEWENERLNNVEFKSVNVPNTSAFNPPDFDPKYGNVEYFKNCLVKQLGANWSDRVLNPEDLFSDIQTVKRLGVPGRQGTTIKIKCDGKDFAIKVAAKGTYCGYGIGRTDGEKKEQDAREPYIEIGDGFLHQARLQQLASEYNVTVPVEAVYCGGQDDVSFIAMLPLKTRLVDYYKHGETFLLKHQKQLWELYKTLDERVGIVHNDVNNLNLMLDDEDNVKLIDFDRSEMINKRWLVKNGPYTNLLFISYLNLWRWVLPGQNLCANYHRLFGTSLYRGITIGNIKNFKDMDRNATTYNNGNGGKYGKVLKLKSYSTLGINWDQSIEQKRMELEQRHNKILEQIYNKRLDENKLDMEQTNKKILDDYKLELEQINKQILDEYAANTVNAAKK